MSRVAFTTFAVLKQPYGHPQVQPFDDRTPAVFAEAEGSPGFIARAKEMSGGTEVSNFERDWGGWGGFAVPRFYAGGRTTATDSRASTLSLWRDLESVYAFVYNGLHLDALKHRHEWFLKPECPTYAVWWVEDDHTPTWAEACESLERLHDLGPAPSVFNFKKPFDAAGRPLSPRSLRPGKSIHR